MSAYREKPSRVVEIIIVEIVDDRGGSADDVALGNEHIAAMLVGVDDARRHAATGTHLASTRDDIHLAVYLDRIAGHSHYSTHHYSPLCSRRDRRIESDEIALFYRFTGYTAVAYPVVATHTQSFII